MCEVYRDNTQSNMEQELEEIDSSGQWQNIYNVSRLPRRASRVYVATVANELAYLS